MKKIFFVLFFAFFCIGTFATFSSAQSSSVLTAQQVAQLFSGRTAIVTDPVPDKSTGRNHSVKVHFSQDGFASVLNEEAVGPAKGRIWSLTEEGQFCFSYKLMARSGRVGRTCGFIAPRGSGVYDMYQLSGGPKDKADRNRKIVGGKGSKHILTFSNFQ